MAVDRAAPGDVLALAPGATYIGPITLPKKAGDAWIVIKTAAPEAEFPAAGRRVSPADARLMPRIVTGGGPGDRRGARRASLPVRRDRDRAEGRRLRDQPRRARRRRPSLEALPHHIVFERCYLHGDKAKGSRRGIALNARDVAIVDSHFSDFKEVGADSQAIAGWNGPGPFSIVNNYLEAAGENVMFGGADPSIPDLVPSDIEIRRNHIAKPLAWKAGEPGLRGQGVGGEEPARAQERAPRAHRGQPPRGQLAAGAERLRRALHGAQPGRRARRGRPSRTSRSPTTSSGAPARASTSSGATTCGRAQVARRIAIRNNLFEDVGGPRWGGGGTLFQILNGAVPGRHREQYRAADRQHHHRRRAAPGRASSSAATSFPTTPTASSAPAPARGRERSRSISPARSSRAT